MIRLLVEVDADDVIAVKETLKDYLEKYRDVRVLGVKEILPEQTRLSNGIHDR